MGGQFFEIKVVNLYIQLIFYFKASVYGYTDIMSLLINSRANVNKVDCNGYTALTLGMILK